MSAVLSSWNRLSGSLPGRVLVSGAVWLRAPYFLTAAPVISELDETHSRVWMANWWLTHNHLGTVHAIASCNLAEYAMGVLAEAAVPASHRWIPMGMEVRYLATAKTSVTADARWAPAPAFGTEKEDATVEVAIRDADGTEAVHAEIRLRISPRPVRR
ncbi:hotdog fold domain-containing protein [Actinomycetospora atypica]|uniref:Hotdog fold domain-containing protein n=1 Tax=Actinomycetospora atypica TaxID=1290095 RepID=A0ABV9YTP9_9PSEU